VNKRISLRSQREKLAKFKTILSRFRSGFELDQNGLTSNNDASHPLGFDEDETSAHRRNSADRGPIDAPTLSTKRQTDVDMIIGEDEATDHI